MVAPFVPRASAKRSAFVHLNVHSGYSLGAGATSIEKLVARASAQKHMALALTDTNAAYGLPLFQTCCDAVDVRAIHGVEIHDRPGVSADGAREVSPRGERPASALLLACDDVGYRNLCRLITARHLDETFTLVDDLPRHAQGLVVCTRSTALLRELHDVLGGDDLYGEIVAHEPRTRREAVLLEARALDRPVVGTHRVFFETPAGHRVHRLRLAIAHLKFLRDIQPGALGRDDLPLDLLPPAAALLPPADAAAAFRHIPQAALNTERIADRCRYRFVRPDHPRLPDLGLAPKESFARLASLCIDGARERYGGLTPEVLSRLERELGVIQLRGFSDYFLIVHDLTMYARGQGIPAVGRGSAANSIVAFALGITSVDPLRHDLPFERFLSAERKDCPDIDLDLDWRGRDQVIQYAYDTYGDDRVAMISTHITWQARSSVREVAKTFGLAKSQIDPLAKHLPWHASGPVDPKRLPPEARTATDGQGRSENRIDTPILEAVNALDGLPRHLSIHVGGIAIGDGPLADSLPLERSAKGLVVTQYDMHGVEATGLVKIDLLGNRALAVIADVVRETTATTYEPLRAAPEGARAPRTPDTDTSTSRAFDRIPEDDARAGELLRTGRTLGCFQVESPAMRGLVVRMDAHTREDAMIALSLIRPGPAGSGMKDAYVLRRRGEAPTPSLHPDVDALFTHTHGVMLYQEDTLRVAAAVAGFDLAQADRLRRALSKKRTPEDLPAMERAFRAGAAKRGVPDDVTEQVWRDIARFSAYAYNKAHAATYSHISWQGLYLKARHPAEFLASVLRGGGGFYAPRAYVEEARRMGCRIEHPCINRSSIGALGQHGVLRLGLDQIKGLALEAPEQVVRIREATGPYVSPTDLMMRTTLGKHDVEQLVRAGALDIFDRPRGELLWMISIDFERYKRAREAKRSRLGLLGPEAWLPPPRHIPVPQRLSSRQLLAMELETLGLSATRHPGELWADIARREGAIATTALKAHVDKVVRLSGWIVTERRIRTRSRGGRRGRYMKFLMLEDVEGTVEVTLFPEVYERVGHRLVDAGPFLIEGMVREDHGALILEAHDLRHLPVPS